jgi:Na+/H+ antiporter NhaD/arsenite permease-like protein
MLASVQTASAAVPGAPALDAASVGLAWCIPFAGLLLSIAVLPVAAPSFWHHHYGKISAAWTVALLVPLAAAFGPDVALYETLHTALIEYVPFVSVLLALYTVSSGVTVSGPFDGRPASNTALLAFGTVIASWIGTTGASILLVQPLIRANAARKHNVHVFVFFIFLVGNIGGSLTPLGDPPLFLGYLEGVDFFWFTAKLALPMLAMAVPLLAAFYALDSYFWRRESPTAAVSPQPLAIEGKRNLVLMAVVVAAVLAAGSYETGIELTIYYVPLPLEGVLRTVLLLAIAWVSWRTTRAELRAHNAFSWEPIIEVAKLFIGIFITMIPALAIIGAGESGLAGPLLGSLNSDGTPDNATYFWVTGIFSSILDNAPTYLIFFRLAGGDAEQLMGPLTSTLVAISAGAVFMGANTYVGNAPNFLIRSICRDRGIKMPSFFGYSAWALLWLTPLYVLVTFLFVLD